VSEPVERGGQGWGEGRRVLSVGGGFWAPLLSPPSVLPAGLLSLLPPSQQRSWRWSTPTFEWHFKVLFGGLHEYRASHRRCAAGVKEQMSSEGRGDLEFAEPAGALHPCRCLAAGLGRSLGDPPSSLHLRCRRGCSGRAQSRWSTSNPTI